MKLMAQWLAASSAILAALPVAAQEDAAREAENGENTIVVTGEAPASPSRAEMAEQAQEVSRVGRYQLYEEALPRFEAPLCPAVFGLREDYAAAIVARIRANAERLELPLEPEGCTANLLVAFLRDSRTFLADFERERPEMFRTNGAVRNQDAWYKAFNVTPDDELYLPPEERVHIW